MTKIILSFAITLLISLYNACQIYATNQYQEKNTYVDTAYLSINDSFFSSAADELFSMLHEKSQYNLKRAEFLVEWAFYDGTIEYSDFCNEIDNTTTKLKHFILKNNLNKYRTAPNYALFLFFTQPSILNEFKSFKYDFEDPTGKLNYDKLFVSKTLKTHSGQCQSLSVLYKILCDELGGHSALAFAPYHLYIKHIGEDGKWVNFELTSGSLVRDMWMIESMEVQTEAIRNGVFLTALSNKETIAFMIMHLLKAYHNKFGIWDSFTLQHTDKVLQILPNFADALVVKMNIHQYLGLKAKAESPKIHQDYIRMHQFEYTRTIQRLDSLGYTQLSEEDYNRNVAKTIEENKKLNK